MDHRYDVLVCDKGSREVGAHDQDCRFIGGTDGVFWGEDYPAAFRLATTHPHAIVTGRHIETGHTHTAFEHIDGGGRCACGGRGPQCRMAGQKVGFLCLPCQRRAQRHVASRWLHRPILEALEPGGE